MQTSQSSKIAAFLAYLLLVVGWLYIFVFRRKDSYAMFHAKQSVMLVVGVFVVLATWIIFSWFITFIPYVGGVAAAWTFPVVMIFILYLFVSWLMGMWYALRDKTEPLPLVGQYAARFLNA